VDDRRIAPPGLGPDGDGPAHAEAPAPSESEAAETAGEEAEAAEPAPEQAVGEEAEAAETAPEQAGEKEAVAEEAVPETGEPAGEAEPGVGWRRRWGPTARVVLFALVGAAGALALAGRVPAQVGPFDTTMGARPSLNGNTLVHLAPLGTIELDTHDWPIRLDLRVEELGLAEAERIADNPQVIDNLGDDVADDVRGALVRLVLRCVLVATVGGVVGGLAARLGWRSALVGLATGAVLVVGAGAGAAATFDANAVAEPRYTGLLSRAPTAVGDVEDIIDRFGEYREQLSDLVGNVVTLYLAAEDLPTFAPDDDTIRVLHVSDVHLNPQAFDLMGQLTEQFDVDAIADTGDIVDWGTEPESQLLGQIGDLEVPYIFVRGNHDSRSTQRAVAEQPNAVVLDGDAAEVAGLRFWGIGDPRYTPDKDQAMAGPSDGERAEAFAPEVADDLAAAEPPDVDVVLVHDARIAADIGGEVPLVLAGHTHEPSDERIEPADKDEESGDTDTTEEPPPDTRLLVEGSTGGAGLRGLQGDEPKPLQASVLYFDPDTRELLAYDRISVKGLGETGATIDRHVLVHDGDGEGAGA
jgi:predicted phosphodiesterase/phage shock protein PspC (stress-responsive transcriptional regulator)